MSVFLNIALLHHVLTTFLEISTCLNLYVYPRAMVQYSKMPAKRMISKGFSVLNLAQLAKMGSNIQIPTASGPVLRQRRHNDEASKAAAVPQRHAGMTQHQLTDSK